MFDPYLLNLFACWVIFHGFDVFCFSKLTVSKKIQNTIRLSNSSNPDQDRHLGPNSLQRLSADDKCHRQQGKSFKKTFDAFHV